MDFLAVLGYSRAGLSLIPRVHLRFVFFEYSLSCSAVPTAENPIDLKPLSSSNQSSGLIPISSMVLAVFSEIKPLLSPRKQRPVSSTRLM